MKICPTIALTESELDFSFIRASGPGGQNVNKVATAVQLRFNVITSPSLPESVRARLLILAANQINNQGELIIKASRHRTQERNKQDAIKRLRQFVLQATIAPKKRKKTKPTAASIERRLTQKRQRSRTKTLRRNKPNVEE